MKRGRRRSRTSPTDRDLQAYVDGELEEAKRREVEAAVRTDARVRMAVERYEAQRRGIRRLYDPVLGESIPGRLASLLQHAAPPKLPPKARGTRRSH